MNTRLKALVIALLLAVSTVGCSSPNKNTAVSEAVTEADADAAEASLIYEAIFLDNDEIEKLFASVRGKDAPFDKVTQDYHVTTEYMPAEGHAEWYGEKVSVHIIAYAVGEVKMEDGNMTSNEGFKAEVTSGSSEFNDYLKSLNKNYHITGAYKDEAKYTEYIVFSDGEPMDVYVTGTFGGYFSDNTFNFGSAGTD